MKKSKFLNLTNIRHIGIRDLHKLQKQLLDLLYAFLLSDMLKRIFQERRWQLSGVYKQLQRLPRWDNVYDMREHLLFGSWQHKLPEV